MAEKIYAYLIKFIQKKPIKFFVLKLVEFVYFLIRVWQIWVEYIIIKLLVLTAVGLVLAYVTYHRNPNTPKWVLAAIVLICSTGAIIAGYAELYLLSNKVDTRTLKDFDKPPLSQFLENGFEHRFKRHMQLWGEVNNYTVILTPAHGAAMKIITIRIPLALPEITENYEEEASLTPYFELVIDNFTYMARADIENYTDKFNYFELMKIINQAIDKIQKQNLKPYAFTE